MEDYTLVLLEEGSEYQDIEVYFLEIKFKFHKASFLF